MKTIHSQLNIAKANQNIGFSYQITVLVCADNIQIKHA